MDQKFYGISEDPWPYEQVVDSLLYFSMSKQQLDEYVVDDFPEILFHGNGGDWFSGCALATITSIFTQILGEGKKVDEWYEDEATDVKKLKSLFHELHDMLNNIEIDELLSNWEIISQRSQELLRGMSWDEVDAKPMNECSDYLDSWSYGAYGEASSRL